MDADQAKAELGELLCRGKALRWERDLAAAEDAFERALFLATSAFGEESREVVSPLVWLAVVRELRGERTVERVLEPKLTALAILRSHVDEGAELADLHRNLGETYFGLEAYVESEMHTRTALALAARAEASHPAFVIRLLEQLCSTMHRTANWRGAVDAGLELLPLVDASPYRPQRAMFPLLNIGEGLVELGRGAEAQPYLARLRELTHTRDTRGMRELRAQVEALLARCSN
jgi:tetratricopeptide (TPR) repeat protein